MIGNQAFTAVAAERRARDEQLTLPSTIGNQAFTSVAARFGKTATATWTGPYRLGTAGNAFEASMILAAIRSQASELAQAGFEDFENLAEEAKDRQGVLGWSPARLLTEDEVEGLTELGREFEDASAPVVAELAATLVGQLSIWTAPISDEDLAALREAVHDQFVHGGDDDAVGEAVELLARAEELVGEIEKWVGYAAQAAELIGKAKSLTKIHEGIERISSKLGDALTLVELAQSIGKLPGDDDVDAIEGAIDIADFVISKTGVPGLTQLWDGYIGKAAETCLTRMRGIRAAVYHADRAGDIAMFFDKHRRDPWAPDISKAGIHFNQDEHFPGGQTTLNYMWQVMRDPDQLDSFPMNVVPFEVEDFFLDRRDELNAGAKGELESDFNWTGRDQAPNLVRWLKRNRYQVWIKLYGGMPAPR